MKFIVVVFFAILALLSVSSVSAQSAECELCKYIVGEVSSLLAENKTISVIEGKIEELCIITGSNEQACKQLVSGYIGEIIILIENYENPATVCAQIGFCSGSSEKAVIGGIKCDICDFLLKKIEGYVTEGKTEQQIINALDGDCKKFHGASSVCESIVNEYASQIISLILNKENPNEICKQLHLC